jgi:hypothetical protein
MLERIIEKFISYFEPLSFMFCWVITFAIMKFIMAPSTRTLSSFCASLFISVPMGVLAGGIMKEVGFGEFVSTGFACAISITAHDIILLLLNKRKIGKYLDKALNNLIDRLTK